MCLMEEINLFLEKVRLCEYKEKFLETVTDVREFHLWTNFVCVLYGIFVTNRTNMLELWLLSLLQSSYFSEKTELLHIWTFKKWQITKI